MAQYKVLQSVAHSLGHSFTSLNTWWGTDYLMGHLIRRARTVGQSTLSVDLLQGRAVPDRLLTPPVQAAVARYSRWLPEPQLVEKHGSDMRYVAAARMSVVFNLDVERRFVYSLTERESPYVCQVEIVDDRGKVWLAELKGWWAPEPERLKPRQPKRSRPWWAIWRPAA